MAKKFYWLKLKRDFFKTKEIKKLRKMAGGDTFTIIYLEMQLLSLENNGKIYYDGVEESFAEELALELDEDPDNVLFTLTFLEKCGWIEKGEEDEFILPQAIDAIGRENPSAERVRRHRDKTKALQCNADVTPCNENETLEKEIEIDKERELERELEKEIPPIIPQGDGGLAAQTTNGSHENGLPLNTDAAEKKPHRKRQEAEKVQYAEYVRMLEKEYQSLIDIVGGEENARRCIEILDNYKGSTGKTYKDDYRAIRSWVIERLREEQARQKRYAPYGKKQEAPSNPQMAMAQRAIEMLNGGTDNDAGSEDY